MYGTAPTNVVHDDREKKAGADAVSVRDTVDIDLLFGAIAMPTVMAIPAVMADRMTIDDPVGVITIHLVCGVLDTFFVGVFSPKCHVTTQLLG